MFLQLVGLTLLGYGCYAAGWMLRRSLYRRMWRRGELSFGEFLEALRAAPAWLTRSTR